VRNTHRVPTWEYAFGAGIGTSALLAAGRIGHVTTISALTPRELEVAALVADGLTNKEIAGRLFLSERTAEGHVEHIRDKLGFGTRSQIATWYTQTRGSPTAAIPAALPAPAIRAAQERRPSLRRLALLGAPVAVVVVIVVAVILTRPTSPTLVLVAGLGTDGESGDGGPKDRGQIEITDELDRVFHALHVIREFEIQRAGLTR